MFGRDPEAGNRAPGGAVWSCYVGAAMIAAAPAVATPLAAQWTAELTVTESAGIRRNAFPTSVRFEVPEGRLDYVSQLRLVDGEADVPAQGTAWSHWPDGSIRDVEVDFNVSIGPFEERGFQLRYGSEVTAGVSTTRGLVVTETDRSIEAGSIRLNKGGYTLIASVTYRDELIGQGRNGLAVVERTGLRRDPREIRWESVEIIKGGPLRVLARFHGSLTLSGGSTADITLDAELPNSKSWLRLSVTVSDPDAKIGELGFETPFRLGAYPWTWDLSTPTHTYGVFRGPTGSMIFSRTFDTPGERSWQVEAGAAGSEQMYEVSSPQEQGDGRFWAHFVGPDQAVAITVEEGSGNPGTSRMWITGTGQTTVTFRSAEPSTEHAVTIHQHYVSTPVPIGAATSPPSILHPLEVTIE